MNNLFIAILLSVVVLFIFILMRPIKQKFDNVTESVCYYVINLEKSTDRRDFCVQEFNKYHINNYKFIDGLEGIQYSSASEILAVNNYSTRFCINGLPHIGCYLSHLKAIKEFYKSSNNIGIILEDDFVFIENPVKHIDEYSKYIKNKTDMIVLSGNTGTDKLEEITDIPTWNAVAYMINKKSAKILLENLTPNSDFLNNTYTNKKDCLYDFALYTVMNKKLKWRRFNLIKQRQKIISNITGLETYSSETYANISQSNNLIISKKLKILTISCYGYGNMGDNMYSEVFKWGLNDCDITKLSDSKTFVNKQKQISNTYPTSDFDFDALILGGGGIITATKLRDSKNLPYYVELAKKFKKPIYIISCGVQGSPDNFLKDFENWKSVFNYAKLITVRSPTDKKLIDTMTDPNKVFYFRDLGYVFPRLKNIEKNPTKTITLIIAGPINKDNKDIVNIVNRSKNDIVIMNMGAIGDDDNENRIRDWDIPGKNVRKYYGAAKAKEFDFYSNSKVGDLTLEKTLNIIYNSEIVLTGRYHGMIFSRSLGIPYDTLGMGTNKVLWELPITDINSDIISSYDNIKYLRKSLGLQDNSRNDTNLILIQK